MAEPKMRPVDLEDALVSLSTRLEFPAEPQASGVVRARLEAQPEERVGRARRAPTRLRPALAIAAVVLAVVGAALVFSPATRNAVADWMGLDGVRIRYGPAPEAAVGADLSLGDEVSLESARSRVEFQVRVPAALGDPDEVYVLEDRPGARVSLVYRATDDLPRTDEIGVGVLIGQFPATIEREILLKKIIHSRSFVESVEVAGTSGYWLSGGPHMVVYLDENGAPREDQARLAGNTLLWQRDGIVYRLESSLSQGAAIAVAESMF